MADSELLDAVRADFECGIEKLALELLLDTSQFQHAITSSSPISWLPSELLQNIFLHYFCGDSELPETLLSVCRHLTRSAAAKNCGYYVGGSKRISEQLVRRLRQAICLRLSGHT